MVPTLQLRRPVGLGRTFHPPGLPATAFPIGRSGHGLPVGVQAIGPFLEDRTPIAFAALLEREFGGSAPPPSVASA